MPRHGTPLRILPCLLPSLAPPLAPTVCAPVHPPTRAPAPTNMLAASLTRCPPASRPAARCCCRRPLVVAAEAAPARGSVAASAIATGARGAAAAAPYLSVTDVGSSTNIRWHESMVARTDKELLLGQRGCVLWFTGERGGQGGGSGRGGGRHRQLAVSPGGVGAKLCSPSPPRPTALPAPPTIQPPLPRRPERQRQEHRGVYPGAPVARARALHLPARRRQHPPRPQQGPGLQVGGRMVGLEEVPHCFCGLAVGAKISFSRGPRLALTSTCWLHTAMSGAAIP
jgi:hypothetical protein